MVNQPEGGTVVTNLGFACPVCLSGLLVRSGGGYPRLLVELKPDREADDLAGWVNRGDYGFSISD
jgi:hypothetical protein